MTYSPECVEAFEAAVVGTKAMLSLHKHSVFGTYTSTRTLDALRLFAANWERAKELEEALKDLADEADYIMSTNGQGNMRDLYSFVVDARKLLEKGNE